MKKLLITTLVGAALAATALPSHAVTTYLGLGIDGSGSISSTNFALQRTGYANALANLPTDGTVAVGVWQFSTSNSLVFPVTLIDSLADRNALVSAINAMSQLGGSTDIAGTIDTITSALLAASPNGAADRQVIDISTDGVQFPAVAGEPDASADAAILAGINQVNGLGIGGSADLSWVPAGSFGIQVDSFDDFGAAIEAKIIRETTTPDGGSSVLMLGGTLVLGFLGRKKFAKAA